MVGYRSQAVPECPLTVMNLPFVDFQRMAGVGRTSPFATTPEGGSVVVVNGRFLDEPGHFQGKRLILAKRQRAGPVSVGHGTLPVHPPQFSQLAPTYINLLDQHKFH